MVGERRRQVARSLHSRLAYAVRADSIAGLCARPVAGPSLLAPLGQNRKTFFVSGAVDRVNPYAATPLERRFGLAIAQLAYGATRFHDWPGSSTGEELRCWSLALSEP